MPNVLKHSLLTDLDVHLFREGKHYRIYEKLGSHLLTIDGKTGTHFAVWAPNARQVSVVGNFNEWERTTHELFPRIDGSGIWEGFIPTVGKGTLYKYYIHAQDGRHLEKGDPYALFWEIPPNTASVVWDFDYEWKDEKWLAERKKTAGQSKPYSVYEVHLGSWKKKENGDSLSYREMAVDMVDYVKKMGFTHIELLPVMEHPYYPSWGYQVTGYFAPSSRFGSPEDFMYLMDAFHAANIGVILDWVPSHFPTDAHGLADFDGTHLYDHADPRKGFHPDWKSAIFNYGRHEVRSFLISNALFWLDKFHADALRVDAVASMLYLDYSREEGEWIPNKYGGNQNLDAIDFIKAFNEAVYKEFPDAETIAEESTSFEGVSKPTFDGGLGFGQKWMMGWMHDTLKYFQESPIHRKYHHQKITFSLVYAFSERFMLPLSHDEVVHGKGPLIDKMPGDEWQKFANMRLMYAYMYTHPGTQLLFMGDEFGQTSEWSIEKGLHWKLTDFKYHKGLQDLVSDLNHFYKSSTALYQQQFEEEGFEWIDLSDGNNSVLVYLRKGKKKDDFFVVACNFTPITRDIYRIGVPVAGTYKEIFNTDDRKYGGSGFENAAELTSVEEKQHGRSNALDIALPPLGVVVFKLEKRKKITKNVSARSAVKKTVKAVGKKRNAKA